MKLKAARTQRGLSQRALADAAGVDQQSISRLETGQTREPSHRIVMCVSKALGVDPQQVDEFAVDLSCVRGKS